MAVHDSIALRRWRVILADHRRSGLTITAFCRSRKLCKSNFFRWRNILEPLDPPAAEPKPAPAFVPLRVVPEAVAEVILPSGLRFRVPLGADALQVARLAVALGAGPC
jgi:hypothetical protein